MVFRIYVYTKNGKVKKVEISDGYTNIRLDPKYIIYKNNKPFAIYNPISGLTLPLNPEYTIIVNK